MSPKHHQRRPRWLRPAARRHRGGDGAAYGTPAHTSLLKSVPGRARSAVHLARRHWGRGRPSTSGPDAAERPQHGSRARGKHQKHTDVVTHALSPGQSRERRVRLLRAILGGRVRLQSHALGTATQMGPAHQQLAAPSSKLVAAQRIWICSYCSLFTAEPTVQAGSVLDGLAELKPSFGLNALACGALSSPALGTST